MEFRAISAAFPLQGRKQDLKIVENSVKPAKLPSEILYYTIYLTPILLQKVQGLIIIFDSDDTRGPFSEIYSFFVYWDSISSCDGKYFIIWKKLFFSWSPSTLLYHETDGYIWVCVSPLPPTTPSHFFKWI